MWKCGCPGWLESESTQVSFLGIRKKPAFVDPKLLFKSLDGEALFQRLRSTQSLWIIFTLYIFNRVLYLVDKCKSRLILISFNLVS